MRSTLGLEEIRRLTISVAKRFQVNGIRALDQGAQNFDPSWTTPAKCQAACESEGYALAAVEHGMNCCEYTGFQHHRPCRVPSSSGCPCLATHS